MMFGVVWGRWVAETVGPPAALAPSSSRQSEPLTGFSETSGSCGGQTVSEVTAVPGEEGDRAWAGHGGHGVHKLQECFGGGFAWVTHMSGVSRGVAGQDQSSVRGPWGNRGDWRCAHEHSMPRGAEMVLKLRERVGLREEVWCSGGFHVPPAKGPIRSVTSLPPCAGGMSAAGSNGGHSPRSVSGRAP